MKVAVFSFDENLAQLLPRHWGGHTNPCRFSGPQSVKHLIESLGIPHTEIGDVLADALPVALGYLVRDGDHVHVCGIRPKDMPAEPRFVIDGHLGRLNAGLRMLGFDCRYHTDYADAELAASSVRENRVLLSRDRRLLMRKAVQSGYLVRSPIPRAQLTEVVHRFRLAEWIRPFRRCMRCNELLLPAAKEAVEERLEPLTRRYYDEFSLCPSCHQVYWKGSHFERMQATISRLHEASGQA